MFLPYPAKLPRLIYTSVSIERFDNECISYCKAFAGQRAQPSPHFSYSEINALPLNGQQAVTAINALWLWCSTAFRWLQQPIGRHLMIDVVEQVIERHPKVKNEGIPEGG